MPVTNPATIARTKLLAVLQAEFGSDAGTVVVSDILHKSLGRDGRTRIGISPAMENPLSSNEAVMVYTMLVQFYGPWKDKIDPNQTVDPTLIETKAERFKRAVRGNDPDVDTAWYFKVNQIQYPHDPTGNATRFEARVQCVGTNTALIETVG